jgi:hypothetical protein
MIVLLTTYLLLFTILSIYRFEYSLFLFFLLLPTYLFRFNIGPLPTTLLELQFIIIFFIGIIKFHKEIITNLKKNLQKSPILFTVIFLFFLSL